MLAQQKKSRRSAPPKPEAKIERDRVQRQRLETISENLALYELARAKRPLRAFRTVVDAQRAQIARLNSMLECCGRQNRRLRLQLSCARFAAALRRTLRVQRKAKRRNPKLEAFAE
jgi:hypothetical protein